MQSPILPDILKRKLVFGDEEQISALREYEKRCDEYYGGEGEKRFAVDVSVDGSWTVHVTAQSREEAEEKVRNETFLHWDDVDISYHAREIENQVRPNRNSGD